MIIIRTPEAKGDALVISRDDMRMNPDQMLNKLRGYSFHSIAHPRDLSGNSKMMLKRVLMANTNEFTQWFENHEVN